MAGSDECRGDGTGARIEPDSPTALREAELHQVLKVMRILKTLVLGRLRDESVTPQVGHEADSRMSLLSTA